MPRLTEKQLAPVIALNKADKITKGSVKKIREYVYNNRETLTADERIVFGTAAFNAERQLDRKAGNRPLLSLVITRANRTDAEISKDLAPLGCVGFETITV